MMMAARMGFGRGRKRGVRSKTVTMSERAVTTEAKVDLAPAWFQGPVYLFTHHVFALNLCTAQLR